MKFNRSYPDSRMRRIRKSSGLRDMLAETTLSKSDLIQPIFIKESLKGTEEIKSMPGINRLGLDILDGEIEKIIDLGIKSIAVFPVIDEDEKDELSQIWKSLKSRQESKFDAILSAAAPLEVPLDLKEKLSVGGRMIIPVGDNSKQILTLITRVSKKEFQETKVEDVLFVPLLKGVVS